MVSNAGDVDTADRTSEFVGLFATHARGVQRYIFTLVANTDVAQEIFQETSVTLWQRWDEFQPGSSFFAWACRVAYFKVLESRQTHRRDRLLFNDALLQTIADERIGLEDMLQARRLVLPGCMRKLPPSDRELIEQRYLDSSTVVEIARQSGRSANTLYKALERIRHALLKCIEETLSKKH